MGESTIVRTLKLIGIIGLLALLATSVTLAQGLPWGADPGGDSDTQEYHTYSDQSVRSGQCIQFDFRVAVVPKSLRVFVQQAQSNNRYSIEVLPFLLGPSAGQYSLCINLERLGLENPSNGAVDSSQRFNPAAGTISDLGVHVWDNERKVSLVVGRLTIIDTVVDSAPATSPQGWCKWSEDIVTTTEDELYLQFSFKGVLTNTNAVVVFIYGSDVEVVIPKWEAGNRFAVDKDFIARHPMAVYSKNWLLQVAGDC